MTAAFVIALVLGVAALYWIILRNSAQKITTQYKAIAKSFGLELNEPKPVMSGFIRPEPSVYGRFQGREVSVSVPGKGLQNTRQIETVLKVEVNERNLAAQITAAGLLGSFRQRDSRGMDRWKSGDKSFDSAIDVRGNNSSLLGRVLSEDIQESILALLKEAKGSIYIGGGVLAYAELGLIADESTRRRFESVLDLFLGIADSIESNSLNPD